MQLLFLRAAPQSRLWLIGILPSDNKNRVWKESGNQVPVCQELSSLEI